MSAAGNPCELEDAILLQSCRIETYRSRGPGGQKKNKTSSAVRITYLPTGTTATATESRSQHENKAAALHRLRLELALAIRSEFGGKAPVESGEIVDSAGRLVISPRSPRYASAIARMFDALEHYRGSVADAAGALGMSTAALVSTLAAEQRVWAEAQHVRQVHGHHALANPRR
jgi:hypothetical protein